MTKNIEVEIRGRLDDQSYDKLKSFLDQNGVHQASQEREMFLLQDYPGYTRDFVGRQVDIRLRNTDGNCEVMLKNHVGAAREEVSLALKDNNLATAKKIVKALGFKNAIWMHRLKEVYEYKDIEWSLVIAPNNIRYYEAELNATDDSEVASAHERLSAAATELKLEVLDDAATRELITRLDKEANKLVEL